MARNAVPISGRFARGRGQQGNPHDRLLVVCEGSKTEPQYFNEIRTARKLSPKLVHIRGCPRGTDPLQIVEAAEDLFRQGNNHRDLGRGCFDRVYVVFDRDMHQSYRQAIDKADSLNGRLKNDEGVLVPFIRVPSSPCFELWFLLHYEDVGAYMLCADIEKRLKAHEPEYRKGKTGMYGTTKGKLEGASRRAERLEARSSPDSTELPHTLVHKLVADLQTLG